MIYNQQISITKNMPVSSLRMLGIKKSMLKTEARFFRKAIFWKLLMWLIVGSGLLVAVASTAQAAACSGGECHVRSTTIDFTVSSDDLTASTVVVGWIPYEIISSQQVTVDYTPDPVDETAGATTPPNPPNVAWIAGPLYPTSGQGGAITQTHTFYNITFNPPNGFCLGQVMKTIGKANVTITDSAGNQTTTNFLIIYDCDQDPPPICRTPSSYTAQCDGGCAGLSCNPTPIGLDNSLQVYGYCSDVNTGIYLKYKLYCVKEDGTLFDEPFYSRDLQCNNSLDTPDSLTMDNEIYIKKPPDNPLCKSYELQACQAVGQNASSCAWYKWRYNFDIQPWLQVKGGSIRSEKDITFGHAPPTSQCNATYTISAKGKITQNTAKNNNCSNIIPGISDVKGDVTASATFTKSSRGVIDIASILKGRFGKVIILNGCNFDFSTIKSNFNNFDVVVLQGCGDVVTINIGSSDTLNNTSGMVKGNKTILAQNDLNLSATANGSLSYQPGPVTSPNQLASLGWIIQKATVAKTDLTIDSDISNLAGVFYVNGDISTGSSNNPLTVQGAMVTSSLGAFNFQRIYASTTVASETIWDDGRAWLNPPPGFVNILSGLPHSTSLKISPNN